jgi:carbon-monoxide dehydrogenase small subunit
VLVNSCCVLGVEAQGRTVETIEGLGTAENLHPLQKAFIEETGMQCGICTPGFLMASKSLLQSNPNPTEEEVRLWLAGNLCRCTGYDKLVRAVLKAGKEMEAA